MIVVEALRKDLQGRVKLLEKDLVEQVGTAGLLYTKLHLEYDQAFNLKRTASTWTVWRDERITQAAVAWVLGTVFVRFCEDNGLFGKYCFLAGPTKERIVWAEELQEEYFRESPTENDRHWLLAAFAQIGRTQAGKTLFDRRHNAAFHLLISPDAAKDLIAFWRRVDANGVLRHDFTDEKWDTRFLGDLYQHLSEDTRKRYALLQTPEFVEEFILKLTLTPAIDEFGLDVVKMIDPACGSGHFVLGAFDRLVRLWKDEHAKEPHEAVKLALEAVHGVDINPFAVAIARFRLLIAALREAGFTTFDQVVGVDFPLNLAIGDSLIRNRQLTIDGNGAADNLAAFKYLVEDLDEYPDILRAGAYHVVVGNPPYITPPDKRLAKLYGDTYSDVCRGSFALSVPFARLFFELSKAPDDGGRSSGYVGQITANSFMKREFGEALIKRYLSCAVDLTHVIDTSGAYIPGHGTPTIILVGRSRPAVPETTVRTVRSVRGEPGEPEAPRDGKVWRAIEHQHQKPGSRSDWVSVDDLERGRYFARFPWVLQDGGLELIETINMGSNSHLFSKARRIGFYGDTHADEVFTLPTAGPLALAADKLRARPSFRGDHVRDWTAAGRDLTVFPYSDKKILLDIADFDVALLKFLWPYRWELWNRSAGNGTYLKQGRRWWQWHQLPRDAGLSDASIGFAFVTTHNHFLWTRSDQVFNRSAPVIKLPEKASEEEHLRLLGVLNSSTACFWLKQVSHDKGIRGEGGGFTPDDWERFYEFTGTKLQEFPLPAAYPVGLATELDVAAGRLTAVSPAEVVKDSVPTRERLAAARAEWFATRGRMIALQEELDWQVYHLYGLLHDELTAPAEEVPELELGQRAFEIVLARRMARGEAETQWFARHGSTPITELPSHWPEAYRAVVEKRIRMIEQNRFLALIERPECKRRWATEGWDRMREQALRNWLLDRCEQRHLWYAPDENGFEQPRPLSTAQLADELRRDHDVVAVAELYVPGADLAVVVASLVDTEHVPFLAALRYKDSGLDKRADWEHVWEMQRAEDAAGDEQEKQQIRKEIPVPPKYGQGDFRKPSYWSNRGKLDVPKERFISYEPAMRDGDPSLLIGWAGWDHLEQAQALALLVIRRGDEDGWGADRLTPLLAGLREILPWVRQWHGGIDPVTGENPAEDYAAFLAERLALLNLTDEDLAGWRPAAARRGRRAAAG